MSEELDYRAVLAEFTYKPNFFLKVFPSGANPGVAPSFESMWWFQAIMLVENSRVPLEMWNPEKQYRRDEYDFFRDYDYARPHIPPKPEMYMPTRPLVEVQGQYTIPYLRKGEDDIFVEWMIHKLVDMEMHELNEWARYKGKLVHDPHS